MEKKNLITAKHEDIGFDEDVFDFLSERNNLVFGKRNITDMFAIAITIAEELSS